jgi:hypothetical protein
MNTQVETRRPGVGPSPGEIQPPTQSEIMKMLRERMPGLRIYNPSDDWLRIEVHGIARFLPPDLGGVVLPHPQTGEDTVCNGEFLVRGRFLTQKDSSGKQIEGQDAQSIVAYIIHRERFGQMGVVWLPGRNEAEDEALRAFGRDKWLDFQGDADEKLLDQRREFKKNWEDRRPGKPVPPPTVKQNRAMERAQTRESRRQYPFECPVQDCPGYATEEWTKFAQHLHAAHRIMASRTRNGEVTLTNAAGDVMKQSARPGALAGETSVAKTEPEPSIEAAKRALEAAGVPVGPERAPEPKKRTRRKKATR